MIERFRTVITAENGVELGAHGTSMFPVAAYDNDYTDREAIWHWHREFELIHVVKGSLMVSVPNEQLILNSGELLFINSGVMHAASRASDGICMLHSAVFMPELLCSGPEGIFWKKYIGPLMEDCSLRRVKFSNDSEHTAAVRDAMNEFWTACLQEPFGYEFLIREQLSKIVCGVLSDTRGQARSVSVRHQRADDRVKKMLEYIHENYMSEITSKALADCANISESECQRCFRSVLGTAPIQYVKKYRLQLAADMLLTTEDTITDIAGRCGFGHMSYFSRAFAVMFGVTPREYRNRRRTPGAEGR